MPSPFHAINTASSALRAFQRGLDVTGHNIANVNTRGYSRQTVDFSPTAPTLFFGLNPIALGTGVGVESVNRIRDLFLQGRMLSAQAGVGRFETLSTNLKQIEPIFNEPGTGGIQAALDRFFNSWSGLASSPNDPGARMEVQLSGRNLSDRIRTAHRDLMATQQQLRVDVENTIGEIDRLSARIADLNAEIRQARAIGSEPNDLLDQRDIALEELAKLAQVSSFEAPDGTISVHMGSYPLVDTAGSHDVPLTFDPATYTVNDGSRAHEVRGGRLYGLFETMNAVTATVAQVDQLANSLREQFNTAHAAGINRNGTTGINFFAVTGTPPDTGAVDFRLSDEVLADPNNIAAGVSGSAGDGGLAMGLSNLRNQQIVGLDSQTFGDFYRAMVSGLGRDTNFAKEALSTQGNIREQVELQRQSISGVSLDDEMANMLRFQRSYQAAARALTVFDQVTEDLLGILR